MAFFWTPTKRHVPTDRKPLISALPLTTSKMEILSFLDWLFIYASGTPILPSYHNPYTKLPRGDLLEPLEPDSNICSTFNALKQSIFLDPILTLPDLSYPFIFYTTERHKIALLVLGQLQGPFFAPTACLSKLDTTIQGWPAGMCALATATFLTQESKGSPWSFTHHTTLRTYSHTRSQPFYHLLEPKFMSPS